MWSTRRRRHLPPHHRRRWVPGGSRARRGRPRPPPAALAPAPLGGAGPHRGACAAAGQRDLDLEAAIQQLAGDPTLGPLVARRPGLRPPGTWNPFETGVRAVIDRHARAGTGHRLAARIVQRLGEPVPGLGQLGLTHTFPTSTALDTPALRHEHAHFASRRLAVLSAPRRSRAPSRDTADLGSPRGRAARPVFRGHGCGDAPVLPARRRSVRSRSGTRESHGPAGASRSPATLRRRAPSQPGPPRPRPRRARATRTGRAHRLRSRLPPTKTAGSRSGVSAGCRRVGGGHAQANRR